MDKLEDRMYTFSELRELLSTIKLPGYEENLPKSIPTYVTYEHLGVIPKPAQILSTGQKLYTVSQVEDIKKLVTDHRISLKLKQVNYLKTRTQKLRNTTSDE